MTTFFRRPFASYKTLTILGALSISSLQAPPELELTSTLLQLEQPKCAICLYGLPRAFKSIVLPSIIENVIIPNEEYECDYFVHFHQLDHEAAGRSGSGGTLNVEEIYLLKEEVEKSGSQIQFSSTSDSDFFEQYGSLLEKIDNTNDENGHPLYFPWKDRTYKKPATTNNIIKMWHSIEQAWHLTTRTGVEYERIAMLRSDVFYMNPLDVFEYRDKIVVPGFARYPVSDRMVVGPSAGVKIWASERFSRMEKHVQDILVDLPGYGLHSETFLEKTIFPAIRDAMDDENAVVEHPSICFFRARADESIWISDCSHESLSTIPHSQDWSQTIESVEDVLGRKCHGQPKRLPHAVKSLKCSMRDESSGTPSQQKTPE